jgi:uncharacterized membrane protein YebE (DUF533 family)
MRKVFLLGLCFVFVIASAGCQSSPNRAPEGALIGGVAGAGLGMIIGNQSKHRGEGRAEGALIGGALGALTGALAGSQMQKNPQGQQPAAQPASPNQMSMQQIIDLSKQGAHEDVIVDRIRLTNSKFSLTPQDIDYLKQNGVSQKVINAMQGW